MNRDIFRWAKQDLAWSMISRRTHDNAHNAKLDFVQFLLEGAIVDGEITDADVECAIRHSGLFDYASVSDQEKAETFEWMLKHGDRYMGTLSREQRAELKLLHELCDRLTHDGDLSVLQQICDLIK